MSAVDCCLYMLYVHGNAAIHTNSMSPEGWIVTGIGLGLFFLGLFRASRKI